MIWVSERQYGQAVTDLRQARQLSPTDPSVPMNLGNVYSKSNQLQLSIESYNEAISLRPDFAQAYYDRAIAYTLKHDYEHANPDFDRAIVPSHIAVSCSWQKENSTTQLPTSTPQFGSLHVP
jgi:tetratricopeptide (TPR) repeat protein